MKLPDIILASTSPFRRELLERLELPFTTQSPGIEEERIEGESPTDMVQRLALEKARAVAQNLESGLVIGSDQCAVLNGMILGKPGDADRAFEQLKDSSGKTIIFHTGLCLLNAASNTYQLEDVLYEVRFRRLSDEQIRNYLDREQPYNCAGSFKSEALGITLFEAMQGEDPTALIGLPLIRLTAMLAAEGVQLPLSPET
jgi:septum formation protein